MEMVINALHNLMLSTWNRVLDSEIVHLKAPFFSMANVNVVGHIKLDISDPTAYISFEKLGFRTIYV